jgi:hypothetical protein
MRSRRVLWGAVGAALLASPSVLAQPPASEMAMFGRAGAGVPDETALDMARRQELIPRSWAPAKPRRAADEPAASWLARRQAHVGPGPVARDVLQGRRPRRHRGPRP